MAPPSVFYRLNKECAKHILAPAAVACDTYIIRRSAHPVSYTHLELPDKEPTEYLLGFRKQLPHWQADGHFRLGMSEVL